MVNNMYIGPSSIISIEHFIFKDFLSTSNHLDSHKRKPCVIISEDDTNYYLLSISSHAKNNIKKRNFEIMGPGGKTNYIDLAHIYVRKISGFPVHDNLDVDTFNNLIDSFIYYQENVEMEPLYDIVKETLTKLNSKKR